MRARAKTHVVWPTIITSAVALMAGCEGASDDGGGGAGASNGSLPGKVIPQGPTDKASDFFEYTASFGNNFIEPVDTHFCTTSFLRGPFQGADDVVQIDWQNQWDTWSLQHNVGPDQFREAHAVCTNWNNFRTASGGFHMVSTGRSANANGFGASEARANEWQGDAMMFLRGIAGNYDGSQYFAKVTQSTTIAGENQLYVHEDSLNDQSTKGFSHVVFVGVPQTQLVKMIGYNTSGNLVRGNVNSSGTFEFPVSTSSGFSGYWMSSVHDGFCGLTRLGGQFDGGEERVRLYPNGEDWYYKVWAHSGKNVHARARCIAYDQR
jgi:hypothetical protein